MNQNKDDNRVVFIIPFLVFFFFFLLHSPTTASQKFLSFYLQIALQQTYHTDFLMKLQIYPVQKENLSS
jgi:hypothetical protein